MTLRQYYAAKAMQGIISKCTMPAEQVAIRAFEYADAMIEAEE